MVVEPQQQVEAGAGESVAVAVPRDLAAAYSAAIETATMDDAMIVQQELEMGHRNWATRHLTRCLGAQNAERDCSFQEGHQDLMRTD